MKQTDIVVLVVVAFFSLIVAFFVPSMLFGKDQGQQVDVVPTISSQFQAPSSQFFNSQSIDPTQLIRIGANNNAGLFNAPTN